MKRVINMSEQQIIHDTRQPLSADDVRQCLFDLGIRTDDRVVVHSSLSALGYVIGGAQSIITALIDTVKDGTLIMPAHSSDWSDPAAWSNPPVPKEWVEDMIRTMPAYDKELTPPRKMGKIAETFLMMKKTERSDHPQASFAAYGKEAAELTSHHGLTPMFGLQSPLGKLYQRGGKILLLGVDFSSCSAFHLAEAITGIPAMEKIGSPIMVNGQRQWVWYEDFIYDADDFPKIGQLLLEKGLATTRPLGNTQAIVADIKTAVDAAIRFIRITRQNQDTP
ncbi:MAG: aminoglycoside N(3)-acetyltransferase [Acholeplasmataceae bacterium]|nr:MAG: aminoglycoside N(3)-acetyltransferase [Acholeplasmataceae bacterium]